MLPNFLVIGAAKAGTTSVWQYLRQHPQIYMSPHKEPRYFALCDGAVDFRGPGDSRFHFVTELSDYEALFAGADGELVRGEVSPWYLYVPTAAPAIHRLIPDVKLVAILRDPVDRAFSNYLHAMKEEIEPLGEFAAAMDDESRRIEANWSPRFHYLQKGFYHRQITHYLELFDRDQMKIYLYEDLVGRPQEMFEDLFSFLGVDPLHRVDTTRKYMDSRQARSTAFERFLTHGNRLTELARPLVPPAMRRRVKANLRRLNRRPKPELSAADRERFVAVYRDDILALEGLLDRDLSEWRAT